MPRRCSMVAVGLMVLVACCVAPVTAADKIKIGYDDQLKPDVGVQVASKMLEEDKADLSPGSSSRTS